MRKDIIGRILSNERKARGMKQQEVADAIQVSVMSVSNMERGFPSVSDDMYMEYAKFIGKGEELFGIEEEMKKRERIIMKELHHIEDIITGNPKMAESLIRDLKQLHMFPEANVFATFLEGRISFELKQWKRSKELLEETLNELDECPSLEKSNLHSICLNDLGRLSFYENDFKTALSYTENAIKVFNDKGDRIYYKPYLYLNKVIYLEKIERDEEACRVLEYLYNHIDKFKDNLGVVIQIHEQFANLLLKSGSPIKAKEHAEKGLQKAWENREYRRLFSIWTLLGNIYVALGDLDEAETRYRKALAFSEYVSDSPYRIGRTHLAFGKLLINLNEKEKAETQLRCAVEIFQSIKNKELNHIDALITIGRLTKSHEMFRKADEIISINNNADALSVDNLIRLCDFYESDGNDERFKHYHHVLYQKLKQEVTQDDNTLRR